MTNQKILILGTTASGKGRLAFDLAKTTNAEIISIDSMKVYRRMDIGTAKPPLQARRAVRYHLIDVAEPSESFSAGLFLELATAAIEQINSRNKPIIAVGGTALYIKVLLYGLFEGPSADSQIRSRLRKQAQAEGLNQLYRRLRRADPAAAERISPNDAKRIIRALEVYEITGRPISTLQTQGFPKCEKGILGTQFDAETGRDNWTVIGLRREKTDTAGRINKRVKKMIEAGLVDEVRSLSAEDKPLSRQARCAIGYAEIIEHLKGNISIDDAIELIKKNSRRLAKNQRTWFKRFEAVNWLDIEPDEPAEKILRRTKTLLHQD